MSKPENRFGKLLGGGFLTGDRALANLPFVGYLTILALIAIKCAHNIDQKVFQIEALRSEMKTLEADFMETRAQVMELGQESKVIEQAKELGLEEAEHPPKKITIPND